MPTEFFECPVLEPGDYHAGQGVLSADRKRFERWVDQFRRMKEAKIEVPLFWGHQMKRGTPKEGGPHPDDRATERARWQAGEVADLKLDETGRPVMRAPVPPGMRVNPETGALEDPVNHTSIKRVSVGIGDWKDGSGNWWEDALLHVALTPLPVWANQTGFTSSAPSEPELLQALSADGRVRLRYTLGSSAMPATAEKPKKGKPEDAPEDDLPPDPAGEGEEGQEAAAMPPADPDAPPDGGMVPDDQTAGSTVAEAPNEPEDPNAAPEAGEMPGEEGMEAPESPLVEMLGKLGIDLPEGTTSENIEQVLVGVAAGLVAAGAKITVGGEHDLPPLKAMEGATQEAPPMFALGDTDGMTPRERKMAEALGRDKRKSVAAECDSFIAAGLPPAIVNDCREQWTRSHLSLDDAGDVHLPAVEGEIRLCRRLAEALGPALKLTACLGDAAPPKEPNPAAEGERKGKAEAGEVAAGAEGDADHQAFVQAEAEKTYGRGVKTSPVKCRPAA